MRMWELVLLLTALGVNSAMAPSGILKYVELNKWKRSSPHLRIPPIPANSLLSEKAAFLRSQHWSHWSLITWDVQPNRYLTWCPALSTWICPRAGRKDLDLHPERVRETFTITIKHCTILSKNWTFTFPQNLPIFLFPIFYWAWHIIQRQSFIYLCGRWTSFR